MHNGYLYPQDVKITIENGKRVVSVDFTLPTKWSRASLKLAETCYLSGWEMARRAYEDEQTDDWLKTVHPKYHEEKLAAKKAHSKGMSVSAFRHFWEKANEHYSLHI